MDMDYIKSRYEETRFTQQMLIDAACDSLYQIGFERNIFTVGNLGSYLYNYKKLLELIEPISNVKDLDALRLIFKGCTDKNCFTRFKRHVKWLTTTAEGKLYLDDCLRPITEPLKKSDLDLAMRLINHGASVKQARKNIKKEIEEIALREGKMQKQIHAIEEELTKSLGPLNGFVELSTQELRIKCYELYKEDCESKGINPIPCYCSKGYETAVDAFGKIVKEQHFMEFVNLPSIAIEISEHFSKIDSKAGSSKRQDLPVPPDE